MAFNWPGVRLYRDQGSPRFFICCPNFVFHALNPTPSFARRKYYFLSFVRNSSCIPPRHARYSLQIEGHDARRLNPKRDPEMKIASNIIATGHEAIELAASDATIQLNKYSDPIEEAREDLTIEDARGVAREDSGLIYAVRRA